MQQRASSALPAGGGQPPPPGNFAHVPVVLSGPYLYGFSGAPPVADLNPPVGVLSAALASAPTAGAEA